MHHVPNGGPGMTISLSGTLVLVGAGKMGGAMLEGWLKAGADPGKIVALDPHASDEMKALLTRHGVALNPPLAGIGAAEVLLVAVKPQVLDDVLPGLKPLAAAKPLVLSVVAGKTIAAFEKHFGSHARIIRTIPNTPAAVGRGITAMAANANVSPDQIKLAEALLGTIGEVVTVDREELIDCVTAVSGSGPAYVFYMTECLAKAGEDVGLPPALAMQLARATVAGSGELMRVTGTEAETLRRNVTSPNGTTHAALQVLMAEDGLKPLMARAVKAACDRSRELAG
jgi:pyrroline-5-carboxylate reductase